MKGVIARFIFIAAMASMVLLTASLCVQLAKGDTGIDTWLISIFNAVLAAYQWSVISGENWRVINGECIDCGEQAEVEVSAVLFPRLPEGWAVSSGLCEVMCPACLHRQEVKRKLGLGGREAEG